MNKLDALIYNVEQDEMLAKGHVDNLGSKQYLYKVRQKPIKTLWVLKSQ